MSTLTKVRYLQRGFVKSVLREEGFVFNGFSSLNKGLDLANPGVRTLEGVGTVLVNVRAVPFEKYEFQTPPGFLDGIDISNLPGEAVFLLEVLLYQEQGVAHYIRLSASESAQFRIDALVDLLGLEEVIIANPRLEGTLRFFRVSPKIFSDL